MAVSFREGKPAEEFRGNFLAKKGLMASPLFVLTLESQNICQIAISSKEFMGHF